MTITETCSCGSSITATGSERLTGVGYQVSVWRRSHACRSKSAPPEPEPLVRPEDRLREGDLSAHSNPATTEES